MKIVILDGNTVVGNDLDWKGFDGLGDLTVYDRTPADKTIERIGDAEVVFTNKVIIDKQVLGACTKLKYIGIFATGFNVVDTKTAREKGVTVCNVPEYSTESVAQMTFAMLLNVAFNVALHSNAVYSGEWQRSLDFSFWKTPLMELSQKTIGIIGYGNIGKKVAEIAKAFNMNVLHTSRRKAEDSVSLEYLLKNSDFVSLHCPLTAENNEMINKSTLSQMKSTAYLINTARGGLVNEKDLADALNNGNIAGACLDVVSVEPILKTNPLLKAKNCIITPHIAWAPKETRVRLLKIAIENLTKWTDGEPQNVVN